jgi:methionyl-tRNA formyltransferase
MKKLPFIFFGSSDFSIFVLKKILKKYKPLLIITLPPQRKNRGLKLEPNPVAIFSLKEKIPFIEINDWTDYKEKTKNLNKDFGVIAGFGKILPEEIIKEFPKGVLNIHPSLLPKYRGPNPIREAILNGDIKTGVTIFLIDNEIDHGPILAQKELTLTQKETYLELLEKLGSLGGLLFNEIIEDYLLGKIQPKEQEHDKATYTRKLRKEDGLLSIRENSLKWFRKVRALNPWPGTYLYINLKGEKKILKVFELEEIPKTEIKPSYQKLKIGQFFEHRNYLALKLKDNYLILKEVQLEGRKTMSSREFLNGYPLESFYLVENDRK